MMRFTLLIVWRNGDKLFDLIGFTTVELLYINQKQKLMKSSLSDEKVTQVGTVAIKTLVLILLAFVCILLGAMLQRGFSGESPLSSGGGKITEEDLVGTADTLGEEAPLTVFSATIEEKRPSSLLVELSSGRSVEVDLASDVEVVTQTPKDQSVLEAEEQAFLNSFPEPGTESTDNTLPEPPAPFIEEVTSLDSVEIGDNVVIETEEDIFTSNTITVVKITKVASGPGGSAPIEGTVE